MFMCFAFVRLCFFALKKRKQKHGVVAQDQPVGGHAAVDSSSSISRTSCSSSGSPSAIIADETMHLVGDFVFYEFGFIGFVFFIVVF